jgi:hypothetical protein
MNTTAAQGWISRVIGAIDNYNMTTENDDLAPMIADLIRDTPRELINDVMREISRYAIAKQQEYTKKRAIELAVAEANEAGWCSSGISTPSQLPESDDADATEERSDADEADDERSDEEEEERSDELSDEEIERIGDIQNAYNEMHEMIRNLEPSAVMLKHLEEWPEIAYEMDKWEYMLLHHLIVKFAPLSVIQAVMEENPDALTFEAGDDGYVPLQLAVRHGRSLEVVQAIYKANPEMVKKVSHRGDTAHSLACKYKRDVSIKVFLYTYRDGAPLPEDEEEQEAVVVRQDEDFMTEFVRSVGLKESFPVLFILLAWIAMLTMSLLAGARIAV